MSMSITGIVIAKGRAVTPTFFVGIMYSADVSQRPFLSFISLAMCQSKYTPLHPALGKPTHIHTTTPPDLPSQALLR